MSLRLPKEGESRCWDSQSQTRFPTLRGYAALQWKELGVLALGRVHALALTLEGELLAL